MPQSSKGHLLIVDDEPFNLEILSEHLQDSGYDITTAEDGEKAWACLQAEPILFDAVLLDRMMPNLNGMEVLLRIKQNPDLQNLPVIMQTAVGSPESVSEGLAAGAYYYLVKPFQRQMLLAIVDAAVNSKKQRELLEAQLNQQELGCRLMMSAEFRFRTLEEARQVTLLVSKACPHPQRIALGLSELLVNAVEHGNLGVGYDEKSRLLKTGGWQEEVLRRQNLPENQNRYVIVTLNQNAERIQITVTDEGNGFDWAPFMDFTPDRAFDPHGRGISMARMLSFDMIQYQGRGNQVIATVLPKPEAPLS